MFLGIKNYRTSFTTAEDFSERMISYFDLILITEHFDESLILLKDLLSLEFSDIIYIKAKENHDKQFGEDDLRLGWANCLNMLAKGIKGASWGKKAVSQSCPNNFTQSCPKSCPPSWPQSCPRASPTAAPRAAPKLPQKLPPKKAAPKVEIWDGNQKNRYLT
jgi:hypothetical protein